MRLVFGVHIIALSPLFMYFMMNVRLVKQNVLNNQGQGNEYALGESQYCHSPFDHKNCYKGNQTTGLFISNYFSEKLLSLIVN